MSLNPLNELKRRLDNERTPLPKRLCLAKNIVRSNHFPAAPKERIVGEWLATLTEKNAFNNIELRSILEWLLSIDDLTTEMKSKLIQVVSQYLQRNSLDIIDIKHLVAFLENSKISAQLGQQIDDYLSITITILQFLRNTETTTYLAQKILQNILEYYKKSKKKLEFITKLLNGENIETIFSYLETEYRKLAVEVCQNILFPINKKSYFIKFLQTLIRKDNIEELIAEKGDNIQSVIKIMNTFFEFPNNRTDQDIKFLRHFIDVFVSSFQKENQIIFAFYIMVADVLAMEQNYIIPAMNLAPILAEDDDKTRRTLFLNLLEVLLANEVDINVRLTDTFGEKVSKVELKKDFISFLQAVMIGQLKLEGKLDRTTLVIMKTALKLDPILIEQKSQIILSAIMTAKKSSSSIMESYVQMMNCLLEISFKLSKGPLFISDILPSVKSFLEASNTEQFQLQYQVKKAKENKEDYEKLQSKLITASDIFPKSCVIMYGKLTSELMFRQNKELLESLQSDLEVYCLMMLEEGFVSPSIIVLTEVISSILSSFLHYNKMADHTVPQNIAEEFWEAFNNFEDVCLNKFGQCLLKLKYNPPLITAFLKLSQSFAQLKLLSIKYSNVKREITLTTDPWRLYDFSVILPCLSKEQWIQLSSKIVDDDAVVILDNLLLTKIMMYQLVTVQNKDASTNETITSTKTHLIQQINAYPILLQDNPFCKTLFSDLDRSHAKQLAKYLINLHLANVELDILEIDAIANNRQLLNHLVLEAATHIGRCFENKTFLKALKKSEYNMASLAKEIDLYECFNQITIKEGQQDDIKNYVDILQQLQIHYLEENYQLLVIFLILAIKKNSNVKKVKRNIDIILQSIYELSLQQPDLYQIFSVDTIFSFQDNTLKDLLTLKLKNSNNILLIKNLLELAVKKVRSDSQLIKSIVENVLKNKMNMSGMESFNDPIFQITCIILPLIVRQKKLITTSVFRSILTDLQEKLHATLLESFKNIDFANSNISICDADNIDDSVVETESTVATLNAMAAYSLTLSKFCETTDAEEIKNLDCVWSGLEFFVIKAIKSIETANSKSTHIESSTQLLNITLRHIKKLETHKLFQDKDKLFLQIYKSIKARLIHEQKKKILNSGCLEELGVTLKFVCELSSIECFSNQLIGDLANLVVLKKPAQILKQSNTDFTSKKVFKYLWSQSLKANIVGTKCVAMSKFMHRTCKTLRNWIRHHYDIDEGFILPNDEIPTENNGVLKVIIVDNVICEVIRLYLDSLSEILMAAKKVSLDYKFVDSIFELQHLIHFMLHNKTGVSCELSWDSFFTLYDGCVAVLNSLIMSREEVLEDRWPCYMQCYRALLRSLCERASSHAELQKQQEDKLAEIAHSIEKLTQSISKRKKHIARIAAYTVGDLCFYLERNAPAKMIRQHLENSVALLIEASDSNYAMPFLRRALAGCPGQMTMTNLYTMYKRYHKYVGNA